MSNNIEHVAQAKHNLLFLESFYHDHEYNDWSITVGFYAALHIVEGAIFLDTPYSVLHSDDYLPTERASHHGKRNIIVKDCFVDIVDSYMLLYKESRNSRYKKHVWTNLEVQLIVKTSLPQIIQWSNEKFKTDFKVKLHR